MILRRTLALTTAAALALAPAAALAQTKVSNLPAASAVSGTDVFPASQGCTGSPPTAVCSATNGVTGTQLQTWAQSGLSASSLSNGVSGSGNVVLATSPSLVTPNLGVAKATLLAGKNAVSSFTLGAAGQVGSGASIACASSHVCDSLSGEVALTTGTGTLAAGTLFTINFADTRTNLANCLVAENTQGSAGAVGKMLWTPTVSTLVVGYGGAAISASTAYTFDYVCPGV